MPRIEKSLLGGSGQKLFEIDLRLHTCLDVGREGDWLVGLLRRLS